MRHEGYQKGNRKEILYFIKWQQTVSFGATRPQHLPKILLHSSYCSVASGSKEKFKVQTLQWLERSGDIETETLVAVLSMQRENVEIIRLLDTLSVIHLCVYWGVEKWGSGKKRSDTVGAIKKRQFVVSRPKEIKILIVCPILSVSLRAMKVCLFLSCWSSCSLGQEHYKSVFQIQAVTLDDRTKGSDWK